MQNIFRNGASHNAVAVTDSPIAHFLFSDTRLAWLWLPLRLWLGWQWLYAGWEKLQNPAWMTTGTALQGYFQRAITVDPKPVAAFDWYRGIMEMLLNTGSYVWFAKLVTLGEVAVGIALIIGAFTGVAAFTGAFMNWNYLMAGSASTNPLLFAFATWLVLAWKTAGWIGADRWLLQALGTPWRPGFLVRHKRVQGEDDLLQAPRAA
ncbi:MAG: thiosulfate dehydrogenase (quinone) large subunit [Chloroflexota bacterium]|nr:thiosulfate dehydrogenase (quinone) large subunit [Chloroflexota bacterium]